MAGLPWNVYIDEAGDEGFKINPAFVGGQGSSRWFIAAAVVVPAEADRQVAGSIDRIKAKLWPGRAGYQKVLHWRDLSHRRKRAVLAELRPEQFMWLAAAFEKVCPTVDRTRFDARIVRRTRPDIKTPLYNYTMRLLFERLSKMATTSGRQLNVTFENRASLSIPDVVAYLRRLETHPGPYGPPTIPPGTLASVTAKNKGTSKMLQLADVCAGALNNALEPDPYGNIDESYLLAVAPKLRRVTGQLWGYGLKLFPQGMPQVVARTPAYGWMQQL